jgi:hypothetical protein
MAREKDRKVASSRAEAINHHNGELFRKIPCIMEIDTVRGVISVSHGGRIKFKVSRIPLGRLALPTITVVAAPEVMK